MIDIDKVDEFLKRVADKYSASEIVEILGLSEEDILEVYMEEVLEKYKEFDV